MSQPRHSLGSVLTGGGMLLVSAGLVELASRAGLTLLIESAAVASVWLILGALSAALSRWLRPPDADSPPTHPRKPRVPPELTAHARGWQRRKN